MRDWNLRPDDSCNICAMMVRKQPPRRAPPSTNKWNFGGDFIAAIEMTIGLISHDY
jgi:hypothetical protein